MLAWCIYTEWAMWAAQRSEGMDWELDTREYCSPDQAPILVQPQERKKMKLSPTLPVAPGKTSKTPLAGLKSTGEVPPPKSKTIRPGSVKRPKTDLERSQKVSSNS